MSPVSLIKTKLFSVVFKVFELMGFVLIPKHFYQPIPEKSDLTEEFYNSMTDLVGVEINENRILDFLESGLVSYIEEFRGLVSCSHDQGSVQNSDFHLINGTFMAVDAHMYYSLIRHSSPQMIIEIGGGNSSKLAAIACHKNLVAKKSKTTLTVIEPYPSDCIRRLLAEDGSLIVSKVQDVDLAVFEQLADGDILFIDSSHVLRSGGDVQYEFLEILPRLKPGVLVHVHDISLPKNYPKAYAENRLYWNEQYLLQAFLTYNSRFEVVWPGNYMMINYPEKMYQLFPEIITMRNYYPQSEPTSFWMRVKS